MIADPNGPSSERALSIHAPRDVPIALDDAERLRRLLDRSLGTGFKLAIIEAATPAARQSIWGWVCDQANVLVGRSVEFDLSRLGAARRFNFWDALLERIDPQVPIAS